MNPLFSRTIGATALACAFAVLPALAAPASAQGMGHPGSPNYLQARADVFEAARLISHRENRDGRIDAGEHGDEKSALGFLHQAVDHINHAASYDGLDLGAQPAPVSVNGTRLARVDQLLSDAQAQLHEHEPNYHALHARASAQQMVRQAQERVERAAQAAP